MMVSATISSSANLGYSSFFGLSNATVLSSRGGKCHCCVFKERSTIEPNINHHKLRRMQNAEPLISDSPSSQQDTGPPLVTALKLSAQQHAVRFHFPGHNCGRAAPSSLTEIIGSKPYMHDLPELPELDNLFSPEGPILDAQQQAAKLFGSSETWFLVGGTTCGIQAAIMATCSPGEVLILPRNSHISAISAMVLSGAVPKYIFPHYDSQWDIAGGVTPSQVATAIQELRIEGRKASAVFITSPTYHGICSDLSEISKVCHSHGIPLIVDEAHGAHLGFHPHLPPSALQQGADLAVQSTHKVLCSLTQSSMLHMSGGIVDRERICSCLQTLQSTSHSYLLLASLDAARAQLSENPGTTFNEAIRLAGKARDIIKNIENIRVLDLPSCSNFPAMDPLRLTVGFQCLGMTGYEADEILSTDHNIVCELVGTHSITFVLNLGTSISDIQRLASGIKHVVSASSSVHGGRHGAGAGAGVSAPFTDIEMRLNPRDAFFASKRRVSLEESIGRVCGELICPYPPGVPVLIPGEVVTERALDYLLHVKINGGSITGSSDALVSSILVCNL